MIMTTLLDKMRALSDSNRFRIVMMLMDRTLCVCELLQVLDISGGTLSNHLNLLKNAKLVEQQKVGRWVEYSIFDDETRNFLYYIEKHVSDSTLIDEDRKKISTISRNSCSASANAEK